MSSEQLVVELRRIAQSEVSAAVEAREIQSLEPMGAEDREMMARSIARRELRHHAKAAIRHGEVPLTEQQEAAIVEEVVASLFSALPGLDDYLGRPDVTDVFLNGCDDVRLRTLSGEEIRVAPIASGDDDLVNMLQGLARRGGRLGSTDDLLGVSGSHQERSFDPSTPLLDLHLSDGSRLAGSGWVSDRLYVSIRPHPLVDADQKELVERWGMYDEGIASLLAAAVRARMTILVTGGQSAGKTTLMRALLHECDPNERIVVLEDEEELRLGANPSRHNQVLTFIARPKNMEGEGEVTLADLARHIKRHAPERIVVGEVRGPEVMDMLEAASQGIAGAMCTLHSRDSESAFPRMVLYARKGSTQLAAQDVLGLAALALDLVVHLSPPRDGRRRMISEITHVERFDWDTNQVITNQWFVPDAEGAAVPNPQSPIPVGILDHLADHGYDPSRHHGGLR